MVKGKPWLVLIPAPWVAIWRAAAFGWGGSTPRVWQGPLNGGRAAGFAATCGPTQHQPGGRQSARGLGPETRIVTNCLLKPSSVSKISNLLIRPTRRGYSKWEERFWYLLPDLLRGLEADLFISWDDDRALDPTPRPVKEKDERNLRKKKHTNDSFMDEQRFLSGTQNEALEQAFLNRFWPFTNKWICRILEFRKKFLELR